MCSGRSGRLRPSGKFGFEFSSQPHCIFTYLKDLRNITFLSISFQMPILAGSLKFNQATSNEDSFKTLLDNDHQQQNHHAEHGHPTLSSGLYSCCNIRLRQLLLPMMVSLGSLLVWSFFWHGVSSRKPVFDDLVGRAASDSNCPLLTATQIKS